MRYEPNICVTRLVAKRNNHIAYDEVFSSGINIIRGDNSSGKSTILNFIFYGLGGDLTKADWSEQALKCTHVWLEVRLNGNVVVLRRQVEETSRSGMEIYGGTFESSKSASIEKWLRYPYNRGSKESFSQALFRLLDMPDVAVEGTSNITMHQVLRLLYADQMSPIENLFRFEGFDAENLREAVGNLLCGAFDAEIYLLQQTLRSKEKEFTEASAELKSIFKVAGGDESLGLDWVNQKKKKLIVERDETLRNLSAAEEALYAGAGASKITMDASEKLYKAVSKLQERLIAARADIDALEFEISDSDAFILSISRRQQSLKDANSAAELVGVAHFASCPACFAETLADDDTVDCCHLCKVPVDRERVREGIVNQINDLALQLKQSNLLQKIRRERLDALRAEHAAIQGEWSAKSRELSAIAGRPTTEASEVLRTLQRQLGYLDRSIEDIDRQLNLANRISDISVRKSALETEISNMLSRIDNLKRSQTEQLSKARRKIELETIEFLKGDLKRQDSFVNPRRVDFSFAKNQISVDDHTYFSASSRVILKTSFLVGFLSAAIKNASFRHPRFLMIDITEDKGMEMERSHNFQERVVALSQDAVSEHQIILATAMPSPKVPDGLFVGRFSTLEQGTLKLDDDIVV